MIAKENFEEIFSGKEKVKETVGVRVGEEEKKEIK